MLSKPIKYALKVIQIEILETKTTIFEITNTQIRYKAEYSIEEKISEFEDWKVECKNKIYKTN